MKRNRFGGRFSGTQKLVMDELRRPLPALVRLAAFGTLLAAGLLLLSCQAAAQAPEPAIRATRPVEQAETELAAPIAVPTVTASQTASAQTRVSPTHTPADTPGESSPSPSRTAAETPVTASPNNATPFHQSPTSFPQNPPELPEAIPIFGLVGEHPDRGYEEAVVTATTTDLAERLAIPAETITVASSGRVETSLATPCGTAAKQEGTALGGGLSLGYEVLLAAGDHQYRYVAVGGLAYYCASP